MSDRQSHPVGHNARGQQGLLATSQVAPASSCLQSLVAPLPKARGHFTSDKGVINKQKARVVSAAEISRFTHLPRNLRERRHPGSRSGIVHEPKEAGRKRHRVPIWRFRLIGAIIG